jgi:predicted nucleic acid-binding protein
MTRIFIDTDVVLDLLLVRAPHYDASSRLFALIESGKARGVVSVLTFANLHYILRRFLSRPETIRSLQKLRLLVQAAALTDKILDEALSSGFEDFEDALQYYTAVEHGLDGFITRNKRDYKGAAIPFYTAEEYLSALPS